MCPQGIGGYQEAVFAVEENDAVGGVPRGVENLEAMGADEDDVTVCQCARGLKEISLLVVVPPPRRPVVVGVDEYFADFMERRIRRQADLTPAVYGRLRTVWCPRR